MTSRLLATVFAASLLLLACAVAQESSLKPGINDAYKNPNVEQRVKQFEGESREIAASQKQILKACGFKRGMDIADIGAGTGLFTRPFAKRVGPKGTVFAVDISEKFLEHITKTCKEQQLENVKPILCEPDSTKLPPESVDRAFICDTYHHFEFPFKTMATVHKALRPDGQLIVIDFKKIEGTSPEWVMGHVRADQELVTEEITAAGFELIDTVDIMETQYVLRFKKSTKDASRNKFRKYNAVEAGASRSTPRKLAK
jgi:predicted methyltransferase